MKRIKLLISVGFAALLFAACNPEYNTVGADLVSTDLFDTETREFPVFVSQDILEDVQADQQAVAHFGNYDFPFFGRRKASITSQINVQADPTFGLYSQAIEDAVDSTNVNIINENERVLSAYLEIPFLVNQDDQDNDGLIDIFDVDDTNPNSDSDNDGLTDLEEAQLGTNPLDVDSDGDGVNDNEDDVNDGYDSESQRYAIDSIYGNRNAPVHLKVTELTYFLNSLDPNDNFETAANYYSGTDFYEDGFTGETLFDDRYQLNFEEILFYYEEDDPETPDVDETTQVETRLSPRIRIPLNPDFFQRKLLNEEGNQTLKNQNYFNTHVKGFNIRIDDASNDIYMLLNLSAASIKMTYEYDTVENQGTEDTEDDEIVQAERSFVMPLGGVRINHLKNEGESTINTNVNTNERLVLKGALGTRARITLFDQDDTTQNLENFKSPNILVNEANLVFYVDPSITENWTANDRIAERLYLYRLNDNLPLADYFSDPTNGAEPEETKTVHSGILEYQDGIPYRYKFRITEHVSNLLRSEDENLAENIDLGLVVTSDINAIGVKTARISETDEINFPVAAISNPLGTVLVGPQPDEALENLRLKLEIIYTNFDN